MAALVFLGPVQFGSASNQVLIGSGQNMQNAWDSHSPNLSLMGTIMGQNSAQWTGFAPFCSVMAVGQPTYDSDLKVNGAPMIQGP